MYMVWFQGLTEMKVWHQDFMTLIVYSGNMADFKCLARDYHMCTNLYLLEIFSEGSQSILKLTSI